MINKDCCTNNSITNLCEIQNEEHLAEYLKEILSKVSLNDMYFYHCTSFSSLKSIIESNVFLLSRSSRMNDRAESDIIRENDLGNRLFYACFTLAPESAGLWNMYTEINNGCMLKLRGDYAVKLQNYPVYRFDDELKKIKKETGTDINQKASFYKVAYYGEPKEGKTSISCMNDCCKINSEICNSSKVVGLLKSNLWRFEDEIRLMLKTEDDMPQSVNIGIPLDDNFWKNCEIIISPFSTKEKESEINEFCKSNKIKSSTSLYSGKVNIESKLYSSESTKKWIADKFDSQFGKTEVGTKTITKGNLIALIIIIKLREWRSYYVSLDEYEEYLQDEICDVLKVEERNRTSVKEFVREVIDHLKF